MISYKTSQISNTCSTYPICCFERPFFTGLQHELPSELREVVSVKSMNRSLSVGLLLCLETESVSQLVCVCLSILMSIVIVRLSIDVMDLD